MEKFIAGFEKRAGLFSFGKKKAKEVVKGVNPLPNWDPYAKPLVSSVKKKKRIAVRSKPKPGPTLDYSGGTVKQIRE